MLRVPVGGPTGNTGFPVEQAAVVSVSGGTVIDEPKLKEPLALRVLRPQGMAFDPLRHHHVGVGAKGPLR